MMKNEDKEYVRGEEDKFATRARENRERILAEQKDIMLAVETSCDETAAAVLDSSRDHPRILSGQVASQIQDHEKFGGVVPEIASRRHLELLPAVIEKTMQEAEVNPGDITAVAATRGPGLVGALLVGFAYAKAFAYAREVPFLAINHVAGHIYANFLSHEGIKPPFLCLTVSGGHTDLIYFKNMSSYKILGRTRDDAAGEAFDKIARYLDLGYPGGPVIEKEAEEGDPGSIDLPRAMTDKETYDFSFSGLKTAVINFVHNSEQRGETINIPDLAASFQHVVIESLLPQVERAIVNYHPRSLLLAGGVAANSLLRRKFRKLGEKYEIPFFFPPLELCTDNAAMIGAAAHYKLKENEFDSLSTGVKATLQM